MDRGTHGNQKRARPGAHDEDLDDPSGRGHGGPRLRGAGVRELRRDFDACLREGRGLQHLPLGLEL